MNLSFLFLLTFAAAAAFVAADNDRAVFSNHKVPIMSLTDADQATFQKSLPTTEWIIMIYADWCPACQVIKPYFHQFAADAPAQSSRSIAIIDYSTNPMMVARLGVSHLPSIFHIWQGKVREVSQFRHDLVAMVEGKRWQEVPPRPAWRDPFGWPSSFFAYLALAGYLLIEGIERIGLVGSIPPAIAFFIAFFGILCIAFLFSSNRRRRRQSVDNSEEKEE